jgi:hypothetical protein
MLHHRPCLLGNDSNGNLCNAILVICTNASQIDGLVVSFEFVLEGCILEDAIVAVVRLYLDCISFGSSLEDMLG